MKTVDRIILCAASALVLAGCAKEMDGTGEMNLVKRTFTGYTDVSLTRTSLASDYNVLWTAKDAVSVFAGEDSRKFTVSNLQEENRVATFEGLASYADTYYALYPYDEKASMAGEVIRTTFPTVQTATAGTFAQGANLSVARTSGDVLSFRNAGAIAGFTVKASGLTSVTLSSQAGDVPMSGAVEINASGDEPVMTVTGTTTYVKMEGSFEEGQKYWFVLPPGTYHGLTLTFGNSALEATCVKQHAADVEFGRNSSKWLGDFTISDEDWVVSDYRSYVLNGKSEVDAFVASIPDGEKIVVINLTVTGADVTTEELRAIYPKVSEIRGTLTLDGIGSSKPDSWIDTNNIIEHCDCKGGIVLRNIQNIINPNGFKGYSRIGGDLVIDNCPNLVVDDWILGSGLDVIEEVAGNFEIKGLKKLHGYSLRNLKKVGGNFELSGIEGVWRLNGGLAVERIGGDLVLQDNSNLKSLHGFENLIHIGGNVVIFNNAAIPDSNGSVGGEDCIGYCLIKDLKDMGAIRPDATIKLGSSERAVNVDDLASCSPDKPKSYVIMGMEALQAFLDGKGPEKETVYDLFVSGADITEEAFRNIDDRVGTIVGTLTMEALGTADSWISTDQCLENIDIQGSIIMRDIPAHINPNGLRPTKLTGDVILQNCPEFPTDWDPFTTLTEVGGNIKVIGPMKGFSVKFFPAIEKIGSDFIIENIETNFWDFKSQTLREIGRDLVITGCPYFENFLGFENLTKLGGNVTVIRPAGHGDWLPESDYGTSKVGLCIFKGYKENGVMNPDATVTAIGRAGIGDDWVYNVDGLTACGPGFSE